MTKGYLFDIKEFSVNDGPGVRTTVFLRGCPLHCVWCHNPEGLDAGRGVLVRKKGCLDCGRCKIPCSHPECRGLSRCLHACPKGLVEEIGREWDAAELAGKLMRDAELFRLSGGGVTLSGGEPLFQPEFTKELLQCLTVHKAIESCGYAAPGVFREVVAFCDLVMMDVKLADPAAHRHYTGADNAQILQNLCYLQGCGVPHLLRVPLIPGITDTKENLAAIAALAGESPVELLPYNKLAGVKYPWVGKQFCGETDGVQNAPVDLSIFKNVRIRAEKQAILEKKEH